MSKDKLQNMNYVIPVFKRDQCMSKYFCVSVIVTIVHLQRNTSGEHAAVY